MSAAEDIRVMREEWHRADLRERDIKIARLERLLAAAHEQVGALKAELERQRRRTR